MKADLSKASGVLVLMVPHLIFMTVLALLYITASHYYGDGKLSSLLITIMVIWGVVGIGIVGFAAFRAYAHRIFYR